MSIYTFKIVGDKVTPTTHIDAPSLDEARQYLDSCGYENYRLIEVCGDGEAEKEYRKKSLDLMTDLCSKK